MNKYYDLLLYNLEDIKKYFETENIDYQIKVIKGKKDQDRLLVPRVVKITEVGDNVDIIITYFSNSLFQ